MRDVRFNLRLFQLFAFLDRLEMWDAVHVLYLLQRGFTLAQYSILDTLWYVGTLAFEVPTGAITDRYGKRLSLLAAVLIQALAFGLMVLGRSFPTMMVSYLLWGLASSFETGTFAAFLYDSLREVDGEDQYERWMGQTNSIAILASALGGALAGLLGGIHLAVPLVATAVIALLLVPLALIFREPQIEVMTEPSYTLHIKESFRYASRNRLVTLLLLYSAVMGAAIWALHIFYQPLLDSYGISVQGIGLLYLCFKLSAAAAAHIAHAWHRALGKAALYVVPLVLALSVLGMGLSSMPLALLLVFVPFVIDGLYQPIVSALLNQNLPSGKRATIISLGSGQLPDVHRRQPGARRAR
jgi:MFS family permease